ncbi:MAG: FAD-dependent oxidoreductase [Betaproteobacteria bacterium]|nr:FAD-dependent oxidoreductase [Betaproteobacteria bacterium]NBY04749.1 FAD-dependent oxidoreductase [Betaproteobacteria bacterium]
MINPLRVVTADVMPAESPAVAVAVVGGGACGQVCAIYLRQLGVDVVVLERDAQPCGSTALSSGFIPAAATQVQRAQGIEDSVAQFEKDIQNKAHGQAAPHLVHAYAVAVAQAIDGLVDLGLRLEVLRGFRYPGHSALRMHATPERSGSALMAQLQNLSARHGVDVLTQALVRELWMDRQGRVIGVGYERPDGQIEHLACQALVLACNGYGGNPQMLRQWLPEMADAVFAGHTGNDGSAIAWGQQIGARLADMGAYQGHGSWAMPQGALITWGLMMEGGIQVNQWGDRFHDETQGYSEAATHVLAQPGGMAWNLFDDPVLRFAQDFPDFRDAQAAGAVRSSSELAQLAQWVGCDVQRLQATLSAMVPGQTDALGRRIDRVLQAPYHLIKVTGALFHTQGGLDINERCQVLSEQGQPWPNLFAGGGAARGVSGNAVWGYLSGNGLLSAFASGWICANQAAALVR